MQWWLLGWTSGVYSHFQLLQDYPCFSKDEILYPRPHQPREVVTWTPSCYKALPSWPGGSLVDLGALNFSPGYDQRPHCDRVCKLHFVGPRRPAPPPASSPGRSRARGRRSTSSGWSWSWAPCSQGKSSITLILVKLSIFLRSCQYH